MTSALTVTVMICTHNRVDLLERTIASLNSAARPENAQIDIFVVANACTDATHTFLDEYRTASKRTFGPSTGPRASSMVWSRKRLKW